MSRTPVSPHLRVVGAIFALVVAWYGATVMVGWYAHARAVIQPLLTASAQQFNSALCFLLLGLGVVLLPGRARIVAAAMAGVVMLVGVATAFEYLTGRAIGIDLLLTPRNFHPDEAHGRMAFNTACSFATFGFALLLAALGRGRWRWIALGLASSAVVAVAAISLAGYIAQLPAAYTWYGAKEMALPTAIEFLLLGLAAALVAIDADRRAGIVAAGWHAYAVFLCTGGIMLGLWRGLHAFEAAEDTRTNQILVAQLTSQLRADIAGDVQALAAQAARWRGGVPARDEWLRDAHVVLANRSVPTAVARLDDAGAVWASAEAADGPAFDPVVAGRAEAAAAALLAGGETLPRFVGPVRLRDGDTAVVVVVPLQRAGRPDGELVAEFDLTRWLESVPAAVLADFALTLREAGQPVLARGAVPSRGLPSVRDTLALGGLRGTIELSPRRGLSSALGGVYAVLGIVLATLLAYFVRQGERAVRRSHQLERLLDSSPAGMVLTETDGRIVRANDQARELFGYPAGALVGESIEILVPEAQRAGHVPLRRGFVVDGEHQRRGSLEVDGRRRDGTTLKVEVGLNTVVMEGRRMVLAIVRDVTARYRAEAALRLRTAELARSNADLEQFAYVASHDLRAPLRAVEHLAQWFVQDLDPHMTPEQRENGALLRRRVQRMDRLLSDLLEYSRVTHVHVLDEPVDVGELLDDVHTLFEWPPGFRWAMASDPPRFATNRTGLQLVFANLVGNALKHHDRTDGRVAIGWRDAGAYWEFSVTDDGPGIPERYHEKVFEMFQTLRPRDQVEGSGMGLALVKRLVESRGGAVLIDSGEGRGTTFRFTWPKHWKESLEA